MRGLLPTPADEVDLVEAYAVTVASGQPFVRCNMISSIDGSITVNGRSGALGGPPDRRVFQVLRSWADVIVVGAGTVRAERFGAVQLDEDLRRRRQERGQSPVPVVAVVTRSADLDWSSSLFAEADRPPIVFTTSDIKADAAQHARQAAELVVAGESSVDPARVLAHLAGSGLRSVILEGGPRLNGDFVRAGLLDELCLTSAPRLVGGTGARLLAGDELPEPLDLRIVHLLEEDGFLFSRFALR